MNFLDVSIALEIDLAPLLIAALLAILVGVILWPLEGRIRVEPHDDGLLS